MKVTAFPAALALALLATCASAQQSAQTDATPPHGKRQQRHNPHHEAAMLSRRLNLTPEQTTKVEPVLAGREEKLSTLHADASLSAEVRHDQLRAIRLDTQQQLSKILTAEQMQKMQALHRHRGGRGQVVPNPTGL